MVRRYEDGGGGLPPDLEISPAAAAVSAAQGSKDSYIKKIQLPLIKNKKYKFWFTYLHEDAETKEVTESDRSPIVTQTYAIPNLTKAVKNLTLTPGSQSYGVKFDLDSLSVQEDVVIFESFTSNFATQTIVYTGTSTNVSILTTGATAFSPRWVKVRSRDKWDDLNISEATAGPVTPFSADVDTSIPPDVPTGVLVAAFNETSDPSNYTGYINASWTAPATGTKGYNVGVWESIPGLTIPSKEFKVDGTSTKIEGLFVGKSYYIQVKSLSAFNTPSAWVSPALNYPVVIPGNTAIPGKVVVTGTGAPKSIVLSWGDPVSNAALVTTGGYYEVKLYTVETATGQPLITRKAYSNQASFSGLTTGTQYWFTVQSFTSGSSPVAGELSLISGPFIPTAIDNPDLQADFILANNQFQVGNDSGPNDIHLSAYQKQVDGLTTNGRIYIGGSEGKLSVAVGLYNDSGTPFYADNFGRFSLGDKLTWSGNLATPVLNVKGTIEVAGPSTFSSYVLSGATNSAFIGIGKQVPYRVSSVEQSGTNGLTGIVINKSGTAVNSDYIKSDGTFRLGEGGLTYNGSQLNLIGNIEAKGGTFTGNVQLAIPTGGTTSGTLYAGANPTSGARVRLSSEGIFAYNSTSTDNTSGKTFSLVQSTGLLDAPLGIVGGWTLAPTGFSSLNTKIENNGTITLGDITGTIGSIVRLSATDAFRIWVGSQSSSNAAFKVSSAGVLYATGATITGNVSITSGSTYNSIVDAQNAAAAANTAAGTANTNATNALTTADGKNSIFRSGFTPTALKAGDIWINFNDENKLYVSTAAGSGSWVLSRDAGISAAVTKADDALAKASAAVTTAEAAYPRGSFNKSAILQAINVANGGSGTALSGGVIEANTISATQIVSDYIYTGFISADKINAGTLQGRDINITGETLGSGSYDSDSGTYGNISSASNALASNYFRTPIGGYSPVKSVGVNAIALISTATAGVTSSWYPYFDGAGDLGIKSGSTTNTYRWRNLRLTGDVFIGGDGSTNSVGSNVSGGSITRLLNTGRIYANTLGTGSGSPIVQDSSGFLRVSPSSLRYKENIVPSSESLLNDILQINPVTFSYKEEFSGLETNPILYGLIAEEVDQIQGLRKVINYNLEGIPESISYDKLSVVLAVALKELSEKLDVVQSRLDALEA